VTNLYFLNLLSGPLATVLVNSVTAPSVFINSQSSLSSLPLFMILLAWHVMRILGC
jgi:hypothetical protein